MTLICLLGFLTIFWFLSSLTGRILTASYSNVGRGIPVFLGSIFIVSIGATLLSSGLTILGAIPVVLSYLMIRNLKGNLKEIAKECFQDVFALMVFSIVVIAITLPIYFGLANGKVLSGDYLFYGKLGEYLAYSGIETKDLNYFKLPQGTEVYHYFDLWLIGFLKIIVGCNVGQSVFLTYFLVFSGILWFLITDVIQMFSRNRSHFILGAMSLVFVLGLSGATYLFSLFFGVTEYGDFNGFMNPKFILIYLIILSLFIAAWRKENSLFVLIMFVSIFLYASILPALFGVSTAFFLLNYKWQIFERKQLYPILFLALGFLIFGGFYYFFRSGYDPNEIHDTSIELSDWKVRLNIFGKTAIYILLGLLPLLIFLFINRKNILFVQFRNVLLIFMVGIFFGLIAWVILCSTTDAVQLWSNFYYPAVGCLYLIFIIGFFRRWSFYAVALFVLVDFICPGINQRIVENASYNPDEFSIFNGKKIGFFNFYDPSLNVYSKNDKVYFGNLKGILSFSNASVISLSVPELEVKDADYESVIRSSNIYSLNNFGTLDSVSCVNYQCEMVKKLDLDYIFIHKKRSKKFSFQLIEGYWEEIKSPEPDYFLYKKISV